MKIATRTSPLALWQAHTIQRLLGELSTQTEIEIIKTRGDRIDDVPLAQLGARDSSPRNSRMRCLPVASTWPCIR